MVFLFTPCKSISYFFFTVHLLVSVETVFLSIHRLKNDDSMWSFVAHACRRARLLD
jgi:hypothetical protein